MTIAGTCFSLVSVGGYQQGSILTRANTAYHRYHIYDNETTGYSAIVSKPGDMNDMPQLTWSGYLTASNCGTVAGLCALDGSPDFHNGLVDSISTQTVIYGDTQTGAFSTTSCFGTRLQITGRPNELVQFSVDMIGKTTASTSLPAPGPADKEFFPFERGVNTLGDDALLGFTVTFNAGFYPRFSMDGKTGYSAISEGMHSLTAEFMIAHASQGGEYGAYSGNSRATPTITLIGTKGSTCVIALGGYYTDWQYGDAGGIMVARAIMSGVYDGGRMISIN